LKLKNLSLEREVARLKEDNLELEKILRAKEDTLSKNIINLRTQISELEKENEDLKQRVDTLQVEAEALERQREAEKNEMKSTYEDLLESMKSEIEKGEITITQLKGKLKVNMLDEILFDSGKTTIKPEGVEVLERVGEILLNLKDRAINVEGHTDNVPIGPELARRYPTNWELSAARATHVARYLQEKIGIDPTLLSAIGYGEYYPVASNESEEGQARNRRIEIVLVPKEITPVSRE
jgi:chemotaxis protein MotB